MFGALLITTVVGCEGPQAASRSALVTTQVPVIIPQAETRESQEKGGVEISIAPVSYTASLREDVSIRQVPPPPIVWKKGGDIYVERVITATPCVQPDHLRFVLTINNKMPRVLRGAGTIVQFNVGGRLQAVDQSGYNNFLGAVIPPRQEQQIEIVGPRLDALSAAQGIIGVFLYDVVTNQNEAGVVTEKQNFEWYFDYTLEPRELSGERRTEHVYLSAYEYQNLLIQQAMQPAHPAR